MAKLLLRLGLALLIAVVSLAGYLFSTDENPVTGESQRVALSAEEEVQLGLQSRAEMAQRHGGLHPDADAQQQVDAVGARLVAALEEQLAAAGRHNPYPFEFHLLTDDQTMNAFALPGGQVFITAGLYGELETEGQLAGVIGHEIGHVLARHGSQHLAKAQLTSGLSGAVGVAAGDVDAARLSQIVGSLVNMRHSRSAEIESDAWAVELMAGAGYDPRAMIDVMRVLEQASGGGMPEFLSTHPKPSNREEYIRELLEQQFPNGLPDGLQAECRRLSPWTVHLEPALTA